MAPSRVPHCAEQMLEMLRAIPGLGDLTPKRSYCDEYPFLRSKVKIKQEIVTMGQPDLDPNQPGEYVSQRLECTHIRPRRVLVDTRNDYEVDIGTFAGAINPNTTASGISQHSLKKTSIPPSIKSRDVLHRRHSLREIHSVS